MKLTVDLTCACGREGSVTAELPGTTPIGHWLLVELDCPCGQTARLCEKVGVLVGRDLERRGRACWACAGTGRVVLPS